MTNHTEVINYIIKEKGYKWYLEIGTQSGKNFDSINCFSKIGVDPDPHAKAHHHETSDSFFERVIYTRKVVPEIKFGYDIIFIDGLHTSEQVKKDFENAMACLSKTGCIVLHDTNPLKEEIATHERNTKEWCGDVWKFASSLIAEFVTLPFDYGVTIVKKGEYRFLDREFEWEYFDKHRTELLRITTIEDFKTWL